MGSFFKFILFVTATSFACTALIYEPLTQASLRIEVLYKEF